jgi:glutamate-1-semialdehyde 2,1-aminomutase
MTVRDPQTTVPPPSRAAETSEKPQDQQHAYLQAFIAQYNQRTQRSKHFAQRYRSVLADNRAAFGFHLPLKELCYPIVAERSAGCYIWDIDGNRYIDFIMGFGVNLFGHNPSFVQAALTAQLEKGMPLGPQSELAGEVAELIHELTGAERVTFSNTGTEAVMTAIRLAKAATGRSRIALFSGSYHGHFDGTLVSAQSINGYPISAPMYAGVSSKLAEEAIVLEYDHPESLERIQTHSHELAAVLVEPVQSSHLDRQPQDFLQALRQLTAATGIVLIFDEMVTGFRIHPRGAQAGFAVDADITTYGKIVGGGLPIGIIAGKAAYLDQIDGGYWNYGDRSSPQVKTTFFAGTYCKHPLALAAARAVLEQIKHQGITLQDQLNQKTAGFVARLNAFFATEQVPIQMMHFGSLFGPTSIETSDRLDDHSDAPSSNPALLGLALLTYLLLNKGILLLRGGGFLSTAHTDADLDFIVQAVQESVVELRDGGFLPAKQ